MVEFVKNMHLSHSTYYRDRHSERDLCHDFPGDEILIDGLHAMQLYFWSNGLNIEIPVVRVMNTAHFIAAYMFATSCSGDQLEYDALAYDSFCRDRQLMHVTIIVLAAMLQRTEGFRAKACRNMLLENRSEDFDYGVTLYDRFLRSAEKRFAEEDFLMDTGAQIQRLQAENKELITKNNQLTTENNQLKMEQEQARHISYNVEQMTINMSGGTLVQHADIVQASGDVRVQHTAALSNSECSEAPQSVSAESILGIPAERDYKAVRVYIEERSRFDPDFKTFCEANSRVAICKRLSKEFGWDVDPYGLGRNINRNRKKKS